MQLIGAPSFAIGLMVPVRESGSMLPQMLLAGLVAGFKRKVLLYQLGIYIQVICVFLMALIALTLKGALASWLIVLLVLIFSLGRCLCSLVSKVLLGLVIPKSLRGQVNGWSTTFAGLTSCVVAGG